MKLNDKLSFKLDYEVESITLSNYGTTYYLRCKNPFSKFTETMIRVTETELEELKKRSLNE
jgi:hypothetical protein